MVNPRRVKLNPGILYSMINYELPASGFCFHNFDVSVLISQIFLFLVQVSVPGHPDIVRTLPFSISCVPTCLLRAVMGVQEECTGCAQAIVLGLVRHLPHYSIKHSTMVLTYNM